jgi:hypothetical protein
VITLENLERKPVEYEIPVAVGGGQTLNVARVHRASDASSRTATKDLSVVTRKVPTTLTLTARGTKGSVSEPLPDSYATIPAIAKALTERRLAKHTSSDAADAAKAPAKGDKE